jgi:hypothetical protein
MEDNFVQNIFFSPSKKETKTHDRIDKAKKGWDKTQQDTAERMAKARGFAKPGTKIVDEADCVALLEAVLRSGDKVNIEGDNQKQADFLAACLAKVDPSKVNNLHMVQSSLALQDHLNVFKKGIASKLDFCYSGPVAADLANMVTQGKISIGAIHTYVELYARTYLDLKPKVALVAANAAISTAICTRDSTPRRRLPSLRQQSSGTVSSSRRSTKSLTRSQESTFQETG